MARGLEQHRQRRDAVAALGRALSRRAGSRCELCEASGVPLHPCEVPPLPEEPLAEQAVLLCGRCLGLAEGRAGHGDPASLRFLELAAWSPVPPAQVMAVRLARRLAEARVPWAMDLLDSLYLSPEVEAWLEG